MIQNYKLTYHSARFRDDFVRQKRNQQCTALKENGWSQSHQTQLIKR